MVCTTVKQVWAHIGGLVHVGLFERVVFLDRLAMRLVGGRLSAVPSVGREVLSALRSHIFCFDVLLHS